MALFVNDVARYFWLFVLACLVFPASLAAQTPPKVTFNHALVDASDKGNSLVVKELLRGGTSANARGKFQVTPLMRAAYRGHTEIVELLLNTGADANLVDIGGAAALHLAAREGHLDIVNLLLKHKADVDLVDAEGWTTLMRASVAKLDEVVAALLAAGADVDAMNDNQETALMLAAQRRATKVAKLLLVKGADPNLTNWADKTALDLAKEKHAKRIEHMLLSHKQVAVDSPPVTEIRLPDTPQRGTRMPEGNKDSIKQQQTIAAVRKQAVGTPPLKPEAEKKPVVVKAPEKKAPAPVVAQPSVVPDAPKDRPEPPAEIVSVTPAPASAPEAPAEEEAVDTPEAAVSAPEEKEAALIPAELALRKELERIEKKNTPVQSVPIPVARPFIPIAEEPWITRVEEGARPWLTETPSPAVTAAPSAALPEEAEAVAETPVAEESPAPVEAAPEAPILQTLAPVEDVPATLPETITVETLRGTPWVTAATLTPAQKQALEEAIKDLPARERRRIRRELREARMVAIQQQEERIKAQEEENLEELEVIEAERKKKALSESTQGVVPEKSEETALVTALVAPPAPTEPPPVIHIAGHPDEKVEVPPPPEVIPDGPEPVVAVPESEPVTVFRDGTASTTAGETALRDRLAALEQRAEHAREQVLAFQEEQGGTVSPPPPPVPDSATILEEDAQLPWLAPRTPPIIPTAELLEFAATAPDRPEPERVVLPDVVEKIAAPAAGAETEAEPTIPPAVPGVAAPVPPIPEDIPPPATTPLPLVETVLQPPSSEPESVPEPAFPRVTQEAQTGDVVVAEAVRVPLSAPKRVRVTETPSANVASAPIPLPSGFSPTRREGNKGHWLEIGDFENERAAIAHFDAVTAREKLFLRVKATTPAFIQAGRTPPTRLRVGTFANAEEALEVCALFTTEGMQCSVVYEFNSSEPSRAQRGVSAVADFSPIRQGPTTLYWVQIGAFASERAALREWHFLKEKHYLALGDLKPSIHTPSSGVSGSNPYRLRVGPFTARSAANTRCRRLRQENISCLAVAGR